MTQYQKYGINPLLISVITSKDVTDISPRPTPSMLPGRYAKIVAKNMDKVMPKIPGNSYRVTCSVCGKAGDYDLGTVAVDMQQYYADIAIAATNVDILDYAQVTGYFRCKHCNSAGAWDLAKMSQSMFKMAIMAALVAPALGMEDTTRRFMIGDVVIDGHCKPKWGSDAEEYLLKDLAKRPQEGSKWNRLGNMYLNGKRPDLAIVAYEQAVAVEPGQLEACYSLGAILVELGEWIEAGKWLRQVLAFAHRYKQMPISRLRAMLVSTFQMLFNVCNYTNDMNAILPSKEEMARAFIDATETDKHFAPIDLEILPDKQETLFAAAEYYMGAQRDALPTNERYLKMPATVHDKRLAVNRSTLRPVGAVNKQAPPKKKDKKRKK